MICSICAGDVGRLEAYCEDANHEWHCVRLTGEDGWCRCNSTAPAHRRCCDVCAADREHPELEPIETPKATGLPGAFI